VCDKTCIFFFFPIINKYFLMAKSSLLSRFPSYMSVVGWALWFRRIQVCHAREMILSLKKSTFEKCNFFCYMHCLIFTDSCNTLWTQFNCRAQCNACLLVLTVAKSVHAGVLIFISCFCRIIFKMPFANCTVMQLGICRFGREGAIPVFLFSGFLKYFSLEHLVRV